MDGEYGCCLLLLLSTSVVVWCNYIGQVGHEWVVYAYLVCFGMRRMSGMS